MTRVEPWWVVDVGFVTEDDIKVCLRVHMFPVSAISTCCMVSTFQLCSAAEHKAVDKIIDSGKMVAGLIDKETVLSKYVM